MVTGVDLVHKQLQIASGEGMGLTQDDVTLTGHAIELRLNAEDPAMGFVPSPGLITDFRPPMGPWVRLDTSAFPGYEIPRVYDSMFGKLIVWGENRDVARMRLVRAIDEMVVEGIPSTLAFGRLAMLNEQFAAGEHSTNSVEMEWDLSGLTPHGPAASGDDDAGPAREVTVEVGGRRLEVKVYGELATVAAAGAAGAGGGGAARRSRAGGETKARATAASEDLVAPMQGTVVKYAVAEGDTVKAGDLVVVLEAMKMENNINAHRDGVVTSINHAAGDVVESGAILAHIEGGGDEQAEEPQTAV
jgi:acetyl-CoA/propionyl-CoA carboxylase, biotin carboxylase, biotin carboxyl carrier protein